VIPGPFCTCFTVPRGFILVGGVLQTDLLGRDYLYYRYMHMDCKYRDPYDSPRCLSSQT